MDPVQKHQSPNLTCMRGRLCGDGFSTHQSTWVCLVPDDLEWNEPFNDD